MQKSFPLFSGVIGYVAVAATASGATYWVTSRGYQTELAKYQASRATDAAAVASAALAQFIANADKINSAAEVFQAQQEDYKGKISEVNKAFDAISRSAPLPVSCKPDANRLRSLAAAIDAANSAISGAHAGAVKSLQNPGASQSH